MSAIWHRVVHRRMDDLIKELRSSSPPPPGDNSRSGTAKRLRDYLDRGGEPSAVLHEKATLLGRARRLKNPQELERVAKWLRAPVEPHPPRNPPESAMDAMFKASQFHPLAVQMLCITMADTGVVKAHHRERAAKMQDLPRKLYDSTMWCEKVSRQQALDMCEYFLNPEGERWMCAVRAALDEASKVNVLDLPVPRPKLTSTLERMLAPFVTAARVTPEVVNAAAAHLQAYDEEFAELFFWNSEKYEGHRWLLGLADTLNDMRQTLGVGHRRSRSNSASKST